jgi:leucyl-tRNA synthetase
MNGKLHLGHAFTLTKAEFAARFQQLNGKHVLWPFAYHCTGMPIVASANKLKKELESPVNPEEQAETPAPEKKDDDKEKDASKFSGKKSKAAAKTGKAATQFEILKMSG